ncbi:MAG TPA: hypothetical protein ENJ35_03155 [Gammaproteobacteria bacterium]|nr:hypothetical protein [Gammaproteobacteria bacterium]
MTKKVILGFAIWLGVAGMASAQDPEKVAESVVAKWNAVLKHGASLNDLMRLYSKDAKVLLPNGEMANDKQAIREFWRQLLAKRGNHYELDLEDVIYAKDDTVVSTLRWSELDGNIKYSYDGVIYNVFKRQSDGSWKAQVQRWN